MKRLLAALVIVSFMAGCSEAATLREKAGQLFVIRPDQLDTSITPEIAHNDKTKGITSLNDNMLETLRDYPPGGFALFRKNIASPKQLKALTKSLTQSCKITPIIAIDEEGGRISRIANSKGFSVRKFKSTQSIGEQAIAKEAASSIGKYLHEFGINMNFAPVADVNTNPENIVIGDRAFGSDPSKVSMMVSEYLDGLKSEGILSCIKHFPGHGDTKADSHEGTVIVAKSWSELLKAELIPFIDNLPKADSVMIAHLNLPNITHDNLPATLSRELITGRLREELGYDGVVIADALMMGAITKHYTSAEVAVLALKAGCDVLLMPYDYREAFDGVIEAVSSGRLSETRLDESVNRIMKLKEKI